MVLSLNGKWEFKAKDGDRWLPAKVPGSNYLDLINNKVIDHPFEGANEKDVQWVAEKDWQYRREFEVDDEVYSSDIIDLIFMGLDTLSSVFINESLVMSSDNGLRRHFVDIKPFIKKGKNTIFITFLSPVKYIEDKNKIMKLPKNMNGLDGVSHIRKNQSHFGWDWGPTLPLIGITDDIYIKATKSAMLFDTYIRQIHSDNKVRLDIQITTKFFAKDRDIFTDVIISSPNKEKTISRNIKILSDKTECFIDIENPILWYSNGLTNRQEQPLYDIDFILKEKNIVIDSRNITIGLRTIELDQSQDRWGHKFQFIVNGVPIFAKGVNWIPQDSIKRLDRDGLEKLIKSVRNSNMNMVRVWGGGYYESDYFYDLCDKYGILIWQDFCFACMPYDFDNMDFIRNLRDEITDNVIRLRNRASLAIWCGNNEIELMCKLWSYRRRLIKITEDFFYKTLPSWLKGLDTQRPYWPGSPASGEYLKKVNSDDIGDTHLWQVWHGLRPYNYYRKRYTRFCSEFGFESFPDMRTISTFAKKSDYDITSDVMSAHQKCNSGNQKILFYASMRFRIPKKFEDIVYISQVTQMECVRDATEHWRRNRDRCYGALYWQLNDCWPVSSWASIDYYGRWKALQYSARRFNAPVTISICDEKKRVGVFIVNDTVEDVQKTIEWGIVAFDGKVLKSDEIEIESKALSSEKILDHCLTEFINKYTKDIFFYAKIKGDEKSLRTSLFGKEKNTNLRKPNISKSIEKKEDKFVITIISDYYSRFAEVKVREYDKPLNDNFFDLIPNYKHQIVIDNKDGNIDDITIEDITIITLNDIEPRQSKLKDSLYRTHVRLLPMNFLNAIAQAFSK